MKYAFLKCLRAHSFALTTWGVSLGCAIAIGWQLVSANANGSALNGAVLFGWGLVALLGGAAAWLLAGVVLWPIVGSIVAKVNGAPFHVGDSVEILVGESRERVVRVREVWKDRNQVRVELGETAAVDGRDIFDFYQIVRVDGMQ